MKKFKIEIKETLSRVIEVESDSLEDAIIKAKEKYNNEEVILSFEDFIDTEIIELTK